MSTRGQKILAQLTEHMLVPAKSAITFVLTAVMENGQTYALMEWRTDPPFRSTWSFPGGKVEPGEVPDDAMLREAREELGIEVCGAWPLKRFAAPNNWTLFPYLITAYRGQPPRAVLDSGHPLFWLPLDPKRKLAWGPAQLIAERVTSILERGTT